LHKSVKGASFVFVGTILSIILWFASRIIVIRSTTKEELGLYSLAVAVVSILSLLATAGLQEGSTRYISIFLGQGRNDDAEKVARSSLRLGTVLGFAASLLLYILSEPLADRVFFMPEVAVLFRAISFFSLFFVLSNITIGILRGYGDIKPRVYFVILGQPIFFLILLGIFLSLGGSVLSMASSFFLAMALVWICTAVYGYVKMKLFPFYVGSGGYRKELLKFSLPLVLAAAAGMVFTWTDTVMLGRYSSAEDVGVYNVAVSLARFLYFVLHAASFVFMPIAGQLFSKRQMDELRRTYQVLSKWIFSATLPIFFVLFFFPEMTIIFLFEERYVVSSDALRILSLGFMFSVSIGLSSMAMMVIGLQKEIMKMAILGAILNVVLNYLLIKGMGLGIMGAALATTVSMGISNILIALVLYWRSGIHPITARYVRPVIASAPVALFLYVIAKSLPLYVYMLPLYFLLFVLGYGLSVLVTRSVEREDLELLDAVSERTGIKMKFLKNLAGRFLHR
jgi:O-antigen/teichoic acid export membrane protein